MIKNIIQNTVASETYGLYPSMILIDIDGKDITDKSFENVMKSIKIKWSKSNRIYLKFKKNINREVYTILLSNDLLKYYDQFKKKIINYIFNFNFIYIGFFLSPWQPKILSLF